ncbi:MAG: 4-hydroxy-tetrahydrodipicolinate reductase [Candidatus Methanoplasma sp.]|jgi:4-hydroxy-tetrahydrodipicolinate reductase|nr:4-hydroxy-tetrahydrodipicolinate reductase [Candidatus Methanoplasma sp.]
MIRTVVGGATGKLGRNVCDLIMSSRDIELAGCIVSEGGGNVGKELYPGVFASGPDGILDAAGDADVYVDVTSPDAAAKIIDSIPDTGANLVVGTTAIPRDALDRMAASVSRNGTSALLSANFSISVNVFWKICEEMAGYLPDYDIEIIELHHNTKKDAPSGTTAEVIRRIQGVTGIEKVVNGREGVVGARTREIGVHAVRAGDVVGDHTVLFAKNAEMMELTHRLMSREALAAGCMESIRWIAGRKDGKVHSMNEVLGI